ncbi:MAG: ubiquinone/menaquinone biosynthesis methyltransferase [Actinomycetota bacterium]
MTSRKKKALPGPEEKAGAVRDMFDAIAPRYDLVNRVMTFGMDLAWRKKAVRSLRPKPSDLIADVACGTGDFCREVQRAGSAAVGFDYSFGMLASARTSAPLVQADGLQLPLADASVDGVTCGFALRNVVDIAKLFGEFGRVLKPGGRVAVLEVSEPRSKVLRTGHHVYFHKIVPVVGGLLSDRDAYRYLPESTAYLPPTHTLLDVMVAAGFTGVGSEPLALGAAQLLTGQKR